MKNPYFLTRYSAFSLIELLLVISIVVFAFGLSSQKLFRKKQKVRGVLNELIRLNRRLVVSAKLHNKTYRLVLLLSPEGPEQYWVEKKISSEVGGSFLAAGSSLLSSAVAPSVSSNFVSASSSDDNEGKPPAVFTLDSFFYPKPKIIPSFLEINEVESASWKEVKTEGAVHIYYYPEGLGQETFIRFLRPDNQGRWTLYLDPVTKNLTSFKEE